MIFFALIALGSFGGYLYYRDIPEQGNLVHEYKSKWTPPLPVLLIVALFLGFIYALAIPNPSESSDIAEDSSSSKAPASKLAVKPIKTSSKKHSLGCGRVPTSLRSPPYNLDEFYQRYCDADGIPILASSDVNPEALRIAKRRVNIMTQKLSSKVKWAMIDAHTRIAILGKDQVITDIPEKSELSKLYPEKNYDKPHRSCLLYTSPSPRDGLLSRMPSSA